MAVTKKERKKKKTLSIMVISVIMLASKVEGCDYLSNDCTATFTNNGYFYNFYLQYIISGS